MASILFEKLPASVTSGAWPVSTAEYVLLAALGFIFLGIGLVAGRLIFQGGRRPVRVIEAENRKDRERVELYRATVERQESTWN